MTSDFGFDAGAIRAPANHAIHIGLAHWAFGELAAASHRAPEEIALGISSELRAGDVSVQIFIERMVTEKAMR